MSSNEILSAEIAQNPTTEKSEHFLEITDECLIVLKANWKSRTDHLADSDLLLMANCSIALEYLRSHVMRRPLLASDPDMVTLVMRLTELVLAWREMRSAHNDPKKIPLIPITSVGNLYAAIEYLVKVAVVDFDADDYQREGLFTTCLRVLRKK